MQQYQSDVAGEALLLDRGRANSEEDRWSGKHGRDERALNGENMTS